MRATKGSRGEVMIESMLVVLITMLMLLFIIAMFSLLFFRWNLQTAANDIAARYAQSYSYLAYRSSDSFADGDPQIGSEKYHAPYRYMSLPGLPKMTPKTDAAKQYAMDRLKQSTAGFALGSPKIDIDVVPDFVGRRHVEVRLSGSYTVLMQEVFDLELFGLEKLISYEVYGYADCVDLLDYLNMIEFIDWAAHGAGLDITFISIIDNFIELIGRL